MSMGEGGWAEARPRLSDHPFSRARAPKDSLGDEAGGLSSLGSNSGVLPTRRAEQARKPPPTGPHPCKASPEGPPEDVACQPEVEPISAQNHQSNSKTNEQHTSSSKREHLRGHIISLAGKAPGAGTTAPTRIRLTTHGPERADSHTQRTAHHSTGQPGP